jgi:hypothetical protein
MLNVIIICEGTRRAVVNVIVLARVTETVRGSLFFLLFAGVNGCPG